METLPLFSLPFPPFIPLHSFSLSSCPLYFSASPSQPFPGVPYPLNSAIESEEMPLPKCVWAEPGRKIDFSAFSAENLTSCDCETVFFYGRNHLELD